MNAEIARDYLEDVVAKKRAIPYQRRSRKGRGGNTMAGHRKGKMGPGTVSYTHLTLPTKRIG